MRYLRSHFIIFFGGAVALVVVHTDADIEQRQIVTLLNQTVDDDGAINASRYQYCYSQYIVVNSFKLVLLAM